MNRKYNTREMKNELFGVEISLQMHDQQIDKEKENC